MERYLFNSTDLIEITDCNMNYNISSNISSNLNSSILWFIESVANINRQYENLIFNTLGLSFNQSLFISLLLYCVLTYSLYLLRRFITGNRDTQFIKELSDRPINIRSSSSIGKSVLIFGWNTIMVFISTVLLVIFWNVYTVTGSKIGVDPYSLHGYRMISFTNWLHDERFSSSIDYMIEPKLFGDFIIGTKFLEWIDSLIYIAIGSPLLLLHYWHHGTIVASFNTGSYSSACLTVAIFNSLIHIVMYAYYGLSVFKTLRPYLNSFKIFITVTQIVQFICGIFIGMSHLHSEYADVAESYYNIDGVNYQIYNTITLSFIFSYLIMFIDFFFRAYYGSYFSSNSAKRENKERENKKSE